MLPDYKDISFPRKNGKRRLALKSKRAPKLIKNVDGKPYSLIGETTTRKAVQSL